MQLSIHEGGEFINLDKIIDLNPTIVKPDTPVKDVINLMSGGINTSNSLANKQESPLKPGKKSSYALIVDEEQIVGIFTENDAIALIADAKYRSNKTISEFMSPDVIFLKEDCNSYFATIALAMMRERQIRHLPVVNSLGKLIGIVTYEKICSILNPECLLRMQSVCEMMETKVIHVEGNISLLNLAKLMSQDRVNYAVIVEKRTAPETNQIETIPIGIITQFDLVKFAALQLDLAAEKAIDAIAPLSFSVNPNDSLWEAHRLMLSNQVQQLIVTNQSGELAGVLTQSNILQVFDPLQMSKVVTQLQQQVTIKSKELEQTNKQLKQAYEKLQQQKQQRKLTLESQANLKTTLDNAIAEFNRIHISTLETVAILRLQFPYSNPEINLLLRSLENNSALGMELIEQIFFNSKDENYEVNEQIQIGYQAINPT